MATTFKMKQGDTRPKLTATLYSDAEKTVPVDLTNAASARLIIGTGDAPPVVDKPMAIVDSINGIVEYQWVDGDTDFEISQYNLEIEIIWNDATKSTYPKEDFLTFHLLADLDVA